MASKVVKDEWMLERFSVDDLKHFDYDIICTDFKYPILSSMILDDQEIILTDVDGREIRHMLMYYMFISYSDSNSDRFLDRKYHYFWVFNPPDDL